MAAKSKAIVPTIVPEDPAVKEIMDGFKARLKDGSTASDAWKQPDSFQKACLDLVQAHLHGKLSVSNMIVVIKEASIPTDEEKLKYLLSAVWMTATQVCHPFQRLLVPDSCFRRRLLTASGRRSAGC